VLSTQADADKDGKTVPTRSTQRAQTSAEHGMTQIRLQFFE